MPISKELFDSIDKDGGFASAAPAKASSKGGGAGGDMVDSFIAEASPIAEQISKKIGVSPHIVMAQMALETGWGKSIIPGTNNWGNIKDFSGSGVAATDNQTGSRDKYRAFGSGAEYADAASDLLARKYKSALGTGDNALAYATALKQGGYAEDRDYVAKNVRIADMLKKRLGSSAQWSDDKAIRHDDGRPGAQSKTEALRAGPTAGDLVKTFGASAVSGIGDMGQGLVGEPLAWLANKAAGTEEFEGKNLIAGVSDSIREGLTAGGQMARQDSPSGDVFQPDTWKLPDTTGGMLMIGADGLGSLVPSILPFAGQAGKAANLAKAARAAEIAGDSAKASQLAMQAERASSIAKTAGAAGGFGMTGGAAAGEVRQNVERELQSRTHDDLLKTVPLYRDAYQQTGDERMARKAVVNGAAQYATLFSGAMGAVGGGINAKLLEDVIVKRGVSSALGKLSGNAAVRGVVGAAAGGVGEGFQEVTEKVGQNAGENVGLGRPAAQNVSRDSFGDFLGGAMVGGPVGGLGGGASLANPHTANKQPAQAAAPAQPTITPNSPLANAASIAQAAHTNLAAQQQALVDQEAATAAPDIDPAIVQQRQQEAVRRQAMASQRAAAGLAPDYSGAEDAESEIAGATGAQEQDRILEMNRMMAEEQADLAERRGDMMEAQRIRQSEQQHRESIQASRARNSVGAPSGSFGQMNEFADFLGQEQQDIAARRQVAADRQSEAQRNDALRAQSELEAADARVATQQTKESEQRRRAVLDAILADPATANPAARLAAELKRQGFRDTTPTQAELDTIQRFSDIQNAEAEPDIIPSSPNELDPYQVRQERPQQPAKPRLTVEQIKEAIANGATLSKDVLTLLDGSRVKLKGPQIAAAREAMRKAAPQAEKVVQESRDDLIDRYKQAEPFSDEEYEIYEQLTQLTVEAIEAKLDAGSVPVFDTGRDTFVAVTPSAQQPGKIQVTRYNKDGVFGDTQYDAMKRAVIDNDLYRHRALTPEEAESRFAESLQAEAEYQARKSQAEAPAQPAETPDVSTRTDDQLHYLANNGKPGWKEAAQAELAKRTPADASPANEGKTTQAVAPEAENVDPLDKEISDAAAHLADVLADVFGAKLNITGPQHSAADLLPAMQKVIGLLVQKGFKTFAQAVGQTARMLRDNGAGEHVEKITPRQWKAAYQFAADMPGVEGAESEEAVAALSADKVLAIVSGQVDKAKAEAEARTDTNPSDAQKEAENYRKGKFAWNGQTIAVENPKGSERTGKGEDGAEWRTVMPATYGYFLGTVGSDGDHVDVFMGDTLDAPSFWVINQTQPDSAKFDEHKVVAGVTSADEAKRIYLGSFSGGFGDKVFSSIAGPYPVGELADVLPKLKAKKPFGVKKESPRDAHIRAKEEAYTARREGQAVPPKALEIVRTEAGKEFDKARGAETSKEEPTVEAKDQPAPVKKLQSSTEQHPEDDATFSSDDQPESPAIKQIRQRMDESKALQSQADQAFAEDSFNPHPDAVLRFGDLARWSNAEGTSAITMRRRPDGDLFFSLSHEGKTYERPTPEGLMKQWRQLQSGPPVGMAEIFAGIESKGLARTRAADALASHPRAAQIKYVQANFHDILIELEDKGLVEINCD